MPKNNSKKPHNTAKNQIIYGIHAVKAALLNDKRKHDELLISENHEKLANNYKSKIKKITFLNQKDFKKPSIEEFIKNENSKKKSVLIALDQITDPQNIGSIMRSCALFDCKGILISKNNAPDLTPSMLKAASGAAEFVNFFKVTNLKRSISELKKSGYWVYGFDSSENYKCSNINFSKKSILVFGSEGKGIRDLVKKECDEIIKLKFQPNTKFHIESLNVSNAASIALYEFFTS